MKGFHMESLERETVAQEIAKRISRYALGRDRSAASGLYEAAANYRNRGDELFDLATKLQLAGDVNDELYLMEEGPE